MPIHGEYRMLAAHAKLGRESGSRRTGIVHRGERLRRRAHARRSRGIVDRVDAGVTFVDGLGVGDVQDVALRDRRRLSEDGVLIVVTTVALVRRRRDRAARADRPRLRRGRGLLEELRDEAARVAEELAKDGIIEIKLLQEHMHDAIGKLVYDRTRRRPMILPVVIEV